MYKSFSLLALLFVFGSQLAVGQKAPRLPKTPEPNPTPAPVLVVAPVLQPMHLSVPVVMPAPAVAFTYPVPAPNPYAMAYRPAAQEPEAKNPGIEKTRKISKNFKVDKADKLQIENKYGKVHVNTNGSKNEISVDITIIARGSNEAQAQEVLDKIKIIESKEPNLISLRTQLENITTKGSRTTTTNGKTTVVSNGKSFEINYLVTMPKTNAVALKNSFGDMYVGELNAPADLDISYGNLKTEKLNSGNNHVKVKFGNGNLLYAKQCSLEVAYSNVRLDGSENLDLQSKFSDLTLPQLDDLVIRSKYDKLKIGKVYTMQGSTGYSDCRVDNLHNTLDMKVQYCNNFEVKNASKNFKNINLEGGYSTFNLNFDDNTNFNFNVDLQYGSLKADKELVNFNMVEKDHAKNEYQGKYGKSSPKSNVSIRAKYGDVKFVQASN